MIKPRKILTTQVLALFRKAFSMLSSGPNQLLKFPAKGRGIIETAGPSGKYR